MIEAASREALVEKTPTEARELISKIVANSQQFGVSIDHTPNQVDEIRTPNIEDQLSKLTSLVRQVALWQVQNFKVCAICSVQEHPTDICP